MKHIAILLGSVLELVKKYKSLGKITNNCLNFKDHVQIINNKMVKKVNLISKLWKTVYKPGKQLLLKLIVVPHLRQCSTVITISNKKEITHLQTNFNTGMR